MSIKKAVIGGLAAVAVLAGGAAAQLTSEATATFEYEVEEVNVIEYIAPGSGTTFRLTNTTTGSAGRVEVTCNSGGWDVAVDFVDKSPFGVGTLALNGTGRTLMGSSSTGFGDEAKFALTIVNDAVDTEGGSKTVNTADLGNNSSFSTGSGFETPLKTTFNLNFAWVEAPVDANNAAGMYSAEVVFTLDSNP